jgi:predicted metal-dependent hydrolase
MKASYVEGGTINLKLHAMFLDAPVSVLRALARFLKNPDKSKQKNLSKLFHENGLDIVQKTKLKKSALLKHQGKYFNLKDIYDKINRTYFKNRVRAFITWGNGFSKKRSYSINFGSYNWDSRIIRVHKALDRCSVPRYFIEYIIYHEMLHVYIGLKRDGNGRRKAHNSEFKQREKDFLHYKKAVEWEKKNLWRFLDGKRN